MTDDRERTSTEHLGDCCPTCGKGGTGHYPECAQGATRALPSFVGDFWNYTQNVMPELEKKAAELAEAGGEPAGSFIMWVNALKECVNHFDLGCGFEKSYPECGPWH